MNALLNYPGAKWGLAEEIVALMPPHKSYLEPFFGSGAVLFTKPPSSIETVNDLDGEVVNFFRVLREKPEQLAAMIDDTPYAREVYDDACRRRGRSRLDRAWRFCIRNRMAWGYKTSSKTGFKIDVAGREAAYCVSNWSKTPDLLREYAKRLKMVQIEHLPALELISRFQNPDVLIYADPPYLMGTRGGKQYRHEMTDRDHAELLDALKAHKGPVILSGYDSPLYRENLTGWETVRWTAYTQSAKRREEVVWCNFQVPRQERLF